MAKKDIVYIEGDECKVIRDAYKVGTFTDYAGISREFTICAVSLANLTSDLKVLRLGIAVQRPGDIPSKLGKQIAYGKALKSKACFGTIATDNYGLINTAVVEALLEQEAKHFKENPGKYLAAYDKDKANFLSDIKFVASKL